MLSQPFEESRRAERNREKSLAMLRQAIEAAIVAGLDAHDIGRLMTDSWEKYGSDDEKMSVTVHYG